MVKNRGMMASPWELCLKCDFSCNIQKQTNNKDEEIRFRKNLFLLRFYRDKIFAIWGETVGVTATGWLTVGCNRPAIWFFFAFLVVEERNIVTFWLFQNLIFFWKYFDEIIGQVFWNSKIFEFTKCFVMGKYTQYSWTREKQNDFVLARQVSTRENGTRL